MLGYAKTWSINNDIKIIAYIFKNFHSIFFNFPKTLVNITMLNLLHWLSEVTLYNLLHNRNSVRELSLFSLILKITQITLNSSQYLCLIERSELNDVQRWRRSICLTLPLEEENILSLFTEKTYCLTLNLQCSFVLVWSKSGSKAALLLVVEFMYSLLCVLSHEKIKCVLDKCNYMCFRASVL